MSPSQCIAHCGSLAPLAQAAYFGSLPAARLLIKHGADIKRQSNTDGTPVDVATKRGHAELASKLQRAGAAADGCYKPPSDPSYWPSSCSWDETKKVTAPYDMVRAAVLFRLANGVRSVTRSAAMASTAYRCQKPGNWPSVLPMK